MDLNANGPKNISHVTTFSTCSKSLRSVFRTFELQKLHDFANMEDVVHIKLKYLQGFVIIDNIDKLLFVYSTQGNIFMWYIFSY